jgi:hypothetical protein
MKGFNQFLTLTAPCTRYESEAEFRDVTGLSMMKTLIQSSLFIDVRMKYRNIWRLNFHLTFRVAPTSSGNPLLKPEFSIFSPFKQ